MVYIMKPILINDILTVASSTILKYLCFYTAFIWYNLYLIIVKTQK